MTTNTVTGKVTSTIRHGTTVWGNPMFSVVLDSGATYRLKNDAALVYEIENPEFRHEAHTFTLTRAGRIEGYRRN